MGGKRDSPENKGIEKFKNVSCEYCLFYKTPFCPYPFNEDREPCGSFILYERRRGSDRRICRNCVAYQTKECWKMHERFPGDKINREYGRDRACRQFCPITFRNKVFERWVKWQKKAEKRMSRLSP